MKKIIMHFPGTHNLLLILPFISLFLLFFFGEGWLWLLITLGSVILAFFVNLNWTYRVEIEDIQVLEEVTQIKNPGERRRAIKKLFLRGLKREKQADQVNQMEKRLKEAQKKEKEAKSELAAFGRDLSKYNFRISELENNRKVQEMHITGLKGENELLHKMVKELREENARLKGDKDGATEA